MVKMLEELAAQLVTEKRHEFLDLLNAAKAENAERIKEALAVVGSGQRELGETVHNALGTLEADLAAQISANIKERATVIAKSNHALCSPLVDGLERMGKLVELLNLQIDSLTKEKGDRDTLEVVAEKMRVSLANNRGAQLLDLRRMIEEINAKLVDLTRMQNMVPRETIFNSKDVVRLIENQTLSDKHSASLQRRMDTFEIDIQTLSSQLERVESERQGQKNMTETFEKLLQVLATPQEPSRMKNVQIPLVECI
ncbi:hypothetical protein C8F04DRAFT_1063435 [Mycena alexandri]|uniref:Uncharacterized protein n=1 Tax=Mycena alexandri TaxID=1745969 RepID=A0AAD6TGF0_9AGAR|nr:hypothetical protein C8F04DRAFT_1063435 [Mycena alexandri]